MPLSISVGKAWRRHGLLTLSALACASLTVTGVLMRENGRTTPDLGALSTHNTQLEQTRERLEVMPPTQPIHWQVKRLQALSKVLPEISAFQAVEADPNNYSEAIAQRIGNFGGVVWKVAMKGSFLSLTMLCRIAQARIPLLIDSVRAENGQAHVVLFVLGAPATA